MPPPVDPAATGPVLHRLVEAALAEHGALLEPGEVEVVQRFLALPPAVGHLYARLLQRVRETFRVDGLDEADQAALPVLEAVALVDAEVAPAERLEALRVPELQAVCRALGLPAGGRRATLVERLAGFDPPGFPILRRTLHRPLFRRLQRLLLRHPRADLRVVVLDLIGVQPRPVYTPGPGAPLFASRAELLDFEEARAALDACREGALALPLLEPALAWLAASPPPTPANRHFSTRRVAAKILALAARELERAAEPALALALYERLLEDGALEPGELAQRAVLAAGSLDPAAAVRLADRWLPRVDPASSLALERSARRLARAAGLPRASPRLHAPVDRRLVLSGACGEGARPLYRIDGQDLPVEPALVRLLAARGRRVLHAEAAPWTTLFALILRDLYFLPLPGVLPVPWLTGPLDLGTPAFAEARQGPLETRLAEVRAGAAPGLVRARFQAHAGELLAGARWELCDGAALTTIAQALGGPALARLLGRLAWEGWQAARGLPDLLILPGPELDLPEANPSRLGPGLLLAEVKGPGDSVRDAQAAWFHLLLEEGAPVELWAVAREVFS
jgi:hypothetical protein